jgi:hypothetical protein
MEADGWAQPALRGGGEARLESAVTRTHMAEQYDGADVIRQAVLLGVGIAEAQAFIDGNKRAAMQAMLTFLFVNGVRVPLDDDGDALAGQILAIAERDDYWPPPPIASRAGCEQQSMRPEPREVLFKHGIRCVKQDGRLVGIIALGEGRRDPRHSRPPGHGPPAHCAIVSPRHLQAELPLRAATRESREG